MKYGNKISSLLTIFLGDLSTLSTKLFTIHICRHISHNECTYPLICLKLVQSQVHQDFLYTAACVLTRFLVMKGLFQCPMSSSDAAITGKMHLEKVEKVLRDLDTSGPHTWNPEDPCQELLDGIWWALFKYSGDMNRQY